ncbi:MAG: ribosome recycling factor [Patescibacteria group bacterium]|nr:ribosome recycling factor [Patescibacteria group bacterium]
MDQKQVEQKLKAAVDALKTELQTIRSGRPSPRMVEDIKVDMYGQQMPVKALGSISVIPPREIDVMLWDKSGVATVAKAIEEALKVTANTDGGLIRINLPSLTDERKKEFEKLIRKMTEETRIRVRGVRDDANKEIKAAEAGGLSEDAAFKKKEEVQKAVDATNKDLESLLDQKLKEIFE